MGGADHLRTLANPENLPDTKDEADVKGKGEVKFKEEPGDEENTTKTKREPRAKKEHDGEDNTVKTLCFGESGTVSPSENVIQNVMRQCVEASNANTASEPGKASEGVKGESHDEEEGDGGDVKIKEEPKE